MLGSRMQTGTATSMQDDQSVKLPARLRAAWPTMEAALRQPRKWSPLSKGRLDVRWTHNLACLLFHARCRQRSLLIPCQQIPKLKRSGKSCPPVRLLGTGLACHGVPAAIVRSSACQRLSAEQHTCSSRHTFWLKAPRGLEVV